jgi:hypothetical protein
VGDHGSGGAYFFSVSCAAPNQCVAVGVSENWTKSLIEVGDGASWKRQEAPDPGTGVYYLYGVSCLGDSRRTAVGGCERWARKPASELQSSIRSMTYPHLFGRRLTIARPTRTLPPCGKC